jgi:hypothetical protein
MAKSNVFENALLNLIFKGIPIPTLADNAASSPLTELYVRLHVADPGEAGNQSTNETTYQGYLGAVAVARGAGWVVVDNAVNPAADVLFPACTGGAQQVITHWSVGFAATGASNVMYRGPVTPNIIVVNGVRPFLTPGTTVTES